MSDSPTYQDLIAGAELRREQLLQAQRRASTDLPLRFLRQQAHFTTPASELAMATKAVEGGMASALRQFEKLGLSIAELAENFDLPNSAVESVLGQPSGHAPLVLIDGEDAQALRDDVVLRGRENAVRLFREAKWGDTLRFYRPSGLNLPFCAGDLITVLMRAGEGRGAEDYPIDGVIWPKVEQPEEMEWLCHTLVAIERRLGLPENRLRLQFLVESGWGLAQLPAIVKVCLPRLCGIIFGISDYSADIGLPDIRNGHEAVDLARMLIVNQAGAAGVPAIDSMTLNYPVADKTLDLAANKWRILARLRECYDDAQHGIALGMSGKWVGHPAQLVACLLAYRQALSDDRIAAEVRNVEAYQASVDAQKGATIIDGVMADRANDRHSRALLRKAVAWGRLDAEKAVALGVVSRAELA